jgi:hypothetical protein
MPVWHVSVARIARSMDRILLVAEWPPNVLRQARDIQRRVLGGVGGEWQREEIGESAIHLRRRLSVEEMKILHQVNALCPVFTHGAALSEIAKSIT